ncbi:MAG: hypothetical protein LBG52_05975 [Candidatus Peribacteria bacterium]|nr:hypothetical protein [Candidatus Peribacteria bacterium]
MQFFPIKTRLLLPPKDDLFQVFEESISHLQERDIVFISSKVLAIHQGRCVPVGGIDKSELIKQEADHRIVSDVVPDKDIYLTITNQILIPSAGIDESNANGYYILRPRQLDELTREIHTYFTQKFNLQHL